jgi:predicted RNase H-like HicB family nuclease
MLTNGIRQMAERTLQCYAHGHPDGVWEAICIDLDIAVQGRSFAEVREFLQTAIESYVEQAKQERPEDAERLLNRRSPLHVRARYALGAAVGRLFGRAAGGVREEPFVVSCHA